jgi:tetratricopeptide (TPR) repeat protein
MWFLPSRRAEAVKLYERAAKLAEASLKVNPTEGVVWAQFAYYSGRAGDAQAVARAEARAEALGGQDMYAQYYLAQIAADRHDVEAARVAMEKAERLGYPRRLLQVDPLLKSLLPPAS